MGMSNGMGAFASMRRSAGGRGGDSGVSAGAGHGHGGGAAERDFFNYAGPGAGFFDVFLALQRATQPESRFLAY